MLEAIRESMLPFAKPTSERDAARSRALGFFCENSGATVAQLGECLGCSKRSAERVVAQLKEEGALVRQGSARAGAWVVRILGSSLAVRKRRTGGWGLVPQGSVDAAVAVAGVLGAVVGLCYCVGGSRSGRLCATWFWTDSMEWVSPSSTHSCRLSGVISSG